jgi:hypothetical protein
MYGLVWFCLCLGLYRYLWRWAWLPAIVAATFTALGSLALGVVTLGWLGWD